MVNEIHFQASTDVWNRLLIVRTGQRSIGAGIRTSEVLTRRFR